MVVEHALVGGRRAVEGDLPAGLLAGGLDLGVVAAERDDRLARDGEVLARAPATREAALERGQGLGLEEGARVEGVDEEAVRDLTHHLDHARPDGGQEDRRAAVGHRRAEHRRHQRVRVELAAELEPRAALPAAPDRAEREHELAHALHGARPRLAVALLDVRADLRAEAEHEASARERLEILREIGSRHRVAREGHRDRGAERDRLGALRREHERDERVVLALEAPRAREALRLEQRGVLARARPIAAREGAVDLHARELGWGNKRPPESPILHRQRWPSASPSSARSGAAARATSLRARSAQAATAGSSLSVSARRGRRARMRSRRSTSRASSLHVRLRVEVVAMRPHTSSSGPAAAPPPKRRRGASTGASPSASAYWGGAPRSSASQPSSSSSTPTWA